MGVVVVIQARTGSTRLPGKVLLPAAGRPLLAHMLERVRAAEHATRVVVATTTSPEDDAIEALCRRFGVESFRGHPSDCLDRHLRVGQLCDADAVVKIPSDCPLIDPAVIGRVIGAWRAARAHGIELDYVSNLHPISWPDGNDVEVMSMRALSEAAARATDPFDREHTTPFIWSHPERYRLDNVLSEDEIPGLERYRLVLDWPEDYALIRAVFEALIPVAGPLFDLASIVQLLEDRPQLAAINAGHRGYSHLSARGANAVEHIAPALRGGATKESIQ